MPVCVGVCVCVTYTSFVIPSGKHLCIMVIWGEHLGEKVCSHTLLTGYVCVCEYVLVAQLTSLVGGHTLLDRMRKEM